MGNKVVGCDHVNCKIVDKEETYPVLGEDVTILAHVKTCCDCGREIFDFELDESNLKKAFAKYKRNHSLMTSYEEFDAFLNIVPNRFSGFKKFDFRKFTEMVRFFASRINGNLYKTKLFKLLWYSDMYFFREYTKSISGMNYVHYPYGPVPKEYSFLLGLMEKIGAIRIMEVENQFGSGDVITATSEYDLGNCLSEDELEVLTAVLTKFGEMSAGDISEQSHREKGYMELISYTYAMDM